MKTMKRTIPLVVILCLLKVYSGYSQQVNVNDGIISAIKAGNSKELAKYFNSNIELIILDKEGVYSKPQAELILKDFFSKNVPTQDRFLKLHEGGKDASKYVIGTLITTKGRYRVYYVMKNLNNELSIHNFRIEDENN
jgi:hypothetical protein